jgi:uncharacterized protein (DUF302 family)
MTGVDYHYTRMVTMSVSEAIAALESALKEQQFGVLWHLDMQAKLREKGLELRPEFHVFEVCNPGRAKEALETNIEVGYFLPCKMAVYVKDGETHVGLLRPQLLIDMLGEGQLHEFGADVERQLMQVVDRVAG